jgi:hypothetical protein
MFALGLVETHIPHNYRPDIRKQMNLLILGKVKPPNKTSMDTSIMLIQPYSFQAV